jgi:predicted ATPase/class 3 adenylate cyclase
VNALPFGYEPERNQPPGAGPPTFVFTDIEGSTLRWELHPSAMRGALERHDAIVSERLASHGGHVFNTIGDAFCAAFRNPLDAARAAIAVQRALGAEDFSDVEGLRIRIALHTGYAEERGGDYFGASVNRVARLLAAGHGNQIVLSGVTRDLLRGAADVEFELLDLGEHRLKDLLRPEHVFQIVYPGLQADFPRLRSLEVHANNLPAPVTSFVGRERVVEEVVALLHDHRLVTLTGAGGVGKSRTSLQVAGNLVDGSASGVWFVEFASLREAGLIPIAIAAAAGLTLAPEKDPLAALIDALRSKTLLLVLDNCEHLISAAAGVVESLLGSCPHVAILASSRQPLEVAGEAVYRMPSLEVPRPEVAATIGADEAILFGAVALFVERARDVDRRFQLTDANAPIVAEICLRLDGIALAIELAAARVRILAPMQIRARLDERFRLLIGGNRTALPRQRTLGALIDWSYDLLDEREQTLLCRLSFFSGSFTLEAAEAISGEEDCDVLGLVGSLSDKSLIAAESGSGADAPVRFRLAESIRMHAGGKVRDPAERERLAHLTFAWSLAVAQRAFDGWATLPSDRWQVLYEPEVENLRGTLSLALEQKKDVDLGQRLAACSRRLWGRLAPGEGLHWITAARRSTDERTDPEVAAGLALAAAHLHVALGQHAAALSDAREALAAYRAVPDDVARGEATTFVGFALAGLERPVEAKPYLVEALDLFQKLGQRQLAAFALHDLAIVHTVANDYPQARAYFSSALREFRATENRRGIHAVIVNLAEIEYRLGDAGSAVRTLERALADERETREASEWLANMAAYLIALERWDEAWKTARECSVIARRFGADVVFARSLQRLAAIAALRDDIDAAKASDCRTRAAKLIGFVDAQFEALAATRQFVERIENERVVTALQTALGDADFRRAYDEGATIDVRAAIDLFRSHEFNSRRC